MHTYSATHTQLHMHQDTLVNLLVLHNSLLILVWSVNIYSCPLRTDAETQTTVPFIIRGYYDGLVGRNRYAYALCDTKQHPTNTVAH